MNSDEKITVIIPVYNASKYIIRCMESVCGQTYTNLEIIVINDCSTDDTLEILSKIEDKRIRLINLKENHGQSYGRNIGIKEAKGVYIGFLDADDYIDKNYYEELYRKIKDYNADIALAETKLLFTDGRLSVTRNSRKVAEGLKNKFSLLPHGGVWDKLFKTSFIRENNLYFPEGRIWEDNLYNLKAIYYANKLVTTRNCFYNYIKNDESTTRSVLKIQKRKDDCLYISSEMMDFMKKNKFSHIEKDIVINFILTHVVRDEVRNDAIYAKKLESILGRMEVIEIKRRHLFHISLRKKQFWFFGVDLWGKNEKKG